MPRLSGSFVALRRALVLSLLLHGLASVFLLRAAPPTALLARPAPLLEVTLVRDAPRPQRLVQAMKRPLRRHTARRLKISPRRRAPHSLEVALAPTPVPAPKPKRNIAPKIVPTPAPQPTAVPKPTPVPTTKPLPDVVKPAPPLPKPIAPNPPEITPPAAPDAPRVAAAPAAVPAPPVPDKTPPLGEGTGAGTGQGAGTGSGQGKGSGQGSGEGAGSGEGKGTGAGVGEGAKTGVGQGDVKGDLKGDAGQGGSGNADKGDSEKGDSEKGDSGSGKGQGDGAGDGAGQGKGSGSGGGGSNGGGGGGGGKDGGSGGKGGSNGGGGLPFGVGGGGRGGQGPRHIIYVLDISFSMEPRIARAKQELRDALATLQPEESFNIVAFFGKVKWFSKDLTPVTPSGIAQANAFLDGLQLDGGTNLEKALQRALKTPKVNVVVVITDGVPTYGERNFDKLALRVRALNVSHARIFTVGLVGKSPDGTDSSFEASRLLEKIAQENEGAFRLVALGENVPTPSDGAP